MPASLGLHIRNAISLSALNKHRIAFGGAKPLD